MKYTVSIVFNNQLFRLSVAEGEKVSVSSTQADFIIPNFGHFLYISMDDGCAIILDKNEKGLKTTLNLNLNHPYMLDENNAIALCISEETSCAEIAVLPDSFDICLGRNSEGKGGRKNDIAISGIPFLSRSQFEISRINGKTVLKDLNSANGTFVNGKRVNTVELHTGDEISILTVRILYEDAFLSFKNIPDDPVIADCLHCRPHTKGNETKKELFKRSPRIQEQIPTGKIEIPAPPAKPNKPEVNWLSTLLPAGVTIAIAVTMALAFQNTMMLLYSLPMTVAGVVISIVNYMRGNKTFEKSSEERQRLYQDKLDDIIDDINKKRDAQKRAMLLADPSPEGCLTSVMSRDTKLWCRKPNDRDFLSVRLGTGTVPFSVMLDCPREQLGEEDELKKIPGEICRANRTIDEMPVLCNLREYGVVGLIGTPEETRTQLQNMIFHLATHHCYTELKLVCFFNEADRKELSWLSDLPHTHGLSQNDVLLAGTQEEADAICRSFIKMFNQRKQDAQENNSYGSSPLFLPYVLFLVFEPKLLKKSNPINSFLFVEQGLGIGCIMAVQSMAQLPKQCSEIVTISNANGEIYNTARASERREFHTDKISLTNRRRLGEFMSPLYCDEGTNTSSFPKSYTLYQMLGINSMAEYDIGKSWKSSDLLTSELAPTAPIGILESGDRIFFNSPPTGENGGAHALVAGGTGSGKSETLLSMIVSLALRYPPEEIGFLIIDFKGDSLAAKLKGLPHLRGIITSLDGDELRRSLVSIGAENKKRLRLFKEYNDKHPEDKQTVNDIKSYMKKYRAGKTSEPLPHLFIIVDEFAEMKKQLPDIMDQFLSVAQIGRSLGVHLVLATQSPSGIVDNKIRANIFKYLCLKVANSSESNDVINSNLAASIKDSGRGYLKTDESLQLFQTAYGGEKVYLADGAVSTQIQEAVDAVAEYCRLNGIHKLPDIFCPPLPKIAEYPKSKQNDIHARPFGHMPVGIMDDPSIQFMGEYDIDVFKKNTLIIGSQMSGKTNLLQTIIRGTADRYTPEDVNIYILDFSSLFLKNFETLPHVGGVVTITETEKISNLFRLLSEQIDKRRHKFMTLGVSTYSSYRESGARDVPQILVVVDDLAAAKAYFPMDNDPLLSVCRDGLSLGISVVATSNQPVGGMSYLPTFANRITLYNNDVSVYNTLMGHTPLRPKQLPGRCLVSYKNETFECQSFLAFEGEREIDRSEAIRSFCLKKTSEAKGKSALTIPFVPRNFTTADAFATFADEYSEGRLMFGLDYATVKPLSVKFAALNMLAVSGRDTDVHNFQRYMLLSSEKFGNNQTEFYIVDSIERTLQSLSELVCVKEYRFIAEHAVQLVHQIRIKAEERYECVANGDTSVLNTAPTLILLLNSAEAINAVSKDKAALDDWLALVGKLRAMNVCTIFGSLDNVSIPFGSDVLKKFKDDRKLLFFDDLSNLKIVELPYGTVKKFAGLFQKGDGYLIFGNETSRIRVPNSLKPQT